MITVRRIRLGEGELFRDVRLAALKDAPHAFGSTYASALARTSESWHEQADRTAEGVERATCFAFADGAPVGMAALYQLDDRPGVGEVLQVWVTPEHRGGDVATALMDFLFDWARDSGLRRILATVTADNDRALAFYRRYGFVPADEAPRCKPGDPVLVKEIE